MPNELQFPGESIEKIASDIHDPFFFDKLASDWNIRPRTADEREQLLELATMLRNAHDTETVKTAAAGNQFLAGAIDSLKVAMGAHGYAAQPTSELLGIKNFAEKLASDPAMQKAALEYGQYLAAASN